MAEQNNGLSRRFDIKKGLDIAAGVIGLLAPAALFYAVGYVITQAYVINVGLNGTFWFNEFFYREAGAKFILDIVAAVALLPHIFILLSAALFLFFPTAGAGGWRDRLFERRSADPSSSRPAARLPNFVPVISARIRFWIFLAIIAAALGSIVLLMRLAAAEPTEPDFALRIRGMEELFADYWLLPEPIRQHFFDAKPLLYPTAILLAIAVPVLTVFAGLVYCAFRGTEEIGGAVPRTQSVKRHSRRAFGMLWLAATVMLGSYVVVAYGGLFYDFTAVPLIDKDKCLPISKEDKDTAKRNETTILQCYLVGRFDKWYILLGWERRKDDNMVQPPIYVKQVDGLEPFSILTGSGLPVRGILRQLPQLTLPIDVMPAQAVSAQPSGSPEAAKPRVVEQPREKMEVGK